MLGLGPAPAQLSIGGSSNVLVRAINMAAGATYTLRGTESLGRHKLGGSGTTTGVSFVEWTVPATNDVLFSRSVFLIVKI